MNFIDGEAAAKPGAASLGIRPEHLGADTILYVEMENAAPMLIRTSGEVVQDVGTAVKLTALPGKMHRFDEQGLRLES